MEIQLQMFSSDVGGGIVLTNQLSNGVDGEASQ